MSGWEERAVVRVEDMGPVERAYAEAMHEDCEDGPPHPLSAHSPWSGSDLDGTEPWPAFMDRLARHGLTLALSGSTAPDDAPPEFVQRRLAAGIAYALARAALPGGTETSRDYADRLAPLVIESGWVSGSTAPLDVERLAMVLRGRAFNDAWHFDGAEKTAAVIAAEYDRLAASPDPAQGET